jgi:hypothetical protein
MSLIVEDGSLVANANSYVSLAYANTYFSDRANPIEWYESTEEIKQAALIYATAWVDSNYKWKSSIISTNQSLGWPRVAYLNSDGKTIEGIPKKLKEAVCEMALNWIKEDFSSSEREGIETEKIGSSSITYRTGSKNYTYIKSLLRDYGSSGISRNPLLTRS